MEADLTRIELSEYFLNTNPDPKIIEHENISEKVFILEVLKISKAFQSLNPNISNSVVLISLSNSKILLSSILAAWKSNAVISLLGVHSTMTEIIKILQSVEPSIIVANDNDKRFNEFGALKRVRLSSGVHAILFKKSVSRYAKRISDRDAWFALTSGSTGNPKVSVLTTSNIIHNATEVSNHLNLSKNDRILVFTPPSFTYAINQIFSAFVSNSYIVLWQHGLRSIASLEKFAIQHNVTGISANPTSYQLMTKSISENLNTVRYVLSAGQPLSAPLLNQIKKTFPRASVLNGYGCTENVNRICFANIDRMLENEEFSNIPVGWPIPGTNVKTIDHQSGSQEIVISGKSLMRGYLDEIEKPTDEIKEFKTGDLGEIHPKLGLMLTGRSKTLMNIANVMVSPEEIESIILKVEEIICCAVAPVYDDILGEIPVAICVTESRDSNAIVNKIREECQLHLSSIKCPKKIFIRKSDDIPRTAYGKIDRTQLKTYITDIV